MASPTEARSTSAQVSSPAGRRASSVDYSDDAVGRAKQQYRPLTKGRAKRDDRIGRTRSSTREREGSSDQPSLPATFRTRFTWTAARSSAGPIRATRRVLHAAPTVSNSLVSPHAYTSAASTR